MNRKILGGVLLCVSAAITSAQSIPMRGDKESAMRMAPLGDFQVVELRRYTIKPGRREHFAEYFETYFPEAFQQVGGLALGSVSRA